MWIDTDEESLVILEADFKDSVVCGMEVTWMWKLGGDR